MGEDRQDHYEALGVSPDASEDEIRRAYRWLSRKFHPDQNPGDERAATMMKRINAAFAVLSDESCREEYDRARSVRTSRPHERGAAGQPSGPKHTKRNEPEPRAPAKKRSLGIYTAAIPIGGILLAAWISSTNSHHEPQPSSTTVRENLGAANAALPTSPPPNAASPETTVPDVPPLLSGESPPTEGPNYFDAREISSGGVVAGLDSCENAARKSSPNFAKETIDSYCTCVIDAARRNFRASRDITKVSATSDQLQQCGRYVQGVGSSIGSSPFATAFPRSTPNVVQAWLGCVRTFDAEHGPFCDCYVDAWLSNPQRPTVSPSDKHRCQIYGQYWALTKTHLTARQFRALAPGALPTEEKPPNAKANYPPPRRPLAVPLDASTLEADKVVQGAYGAALFPRFPLVKVDSGTSQIVPQAPF
jgi:hypothetical protein